MVAIGKEDLLLEYERALRAMDDEDTRDTEALLALIARDSLEDRWAELTAAEKKRVEALDGILAARHQTAAEVLPGPYSKDRRRWWWFLHEGPQVREEAERAA